jgi:outer membrane protein
MSCFPEGMRANTGILKEFPIHMKRTLALATLLVSGLISNAVIATAQTAAAPAAPAAAVTAKVAVIQFNAAVAQTNEGQRDFGDVQRKFEPKQAQLKSLNDEIETLKKQLQAQGDKLSAAEVATRTKNIDEKTKSLQRSAEDARNDYQQEMGDTLNGLASKVYEVLEAYAKDHGYTMVVDIGTSQQQAPVVLWAAENTNISQAIIDAYNVKSGVPAPPPSAPSANAAPKPVVKAAPATGTAPKK